MTLHKTQVLSVDSIRSIETYTKLGTSSPGTPKKKEMEKENKRERGMYTNMSYTYCRRNPTPTVHVYSKLVPVTTIITAQSGTPSIDEAELESSSC